MTDAPAKLVGATVAAIVVALSVTASALFPRSAHSSGPGWQETNEDHASRLIAEGVAALERGDLAVAKERFQQLLAARPSDLTAHTYLGVIADRAGDLAEAERHFSSAAAIDPNSPSARNNYGAILLKLGRTKKAAAQFEGSLKLDKNQPSALVNLAQIRFSGGAPEELRSARDLFERAYALAPDAEIARALVVVSLRTGERETAAKYFKEYSAKLPGATSQTTAALMRAELGGALFEAGLLQEALTELSAAVSADPSNSESIVRLAKTYLALNDLPAAGRTLESAVARGVFTAPIYALLSSVYEQSGHIENAIPAMRLAIEREPQSEYYRFAYGMLLANSLAPRAAVIRLEEALQLFPRSARLWLALGIAHFKGGMNDKAAAAIRRAIELDPRFAPAFAYLGMTHVEVVQYDEAIKRYEEALAINEKLGVVDYLIADVLLKQTNSDSVRIENHLRRAVKWEPSFIPAHLALGKLYSRKNRLDEAAAELEIVVKLDPNLAEAHYQLGRVYTRLKRTSEAQNTLATFKRLSETQKEQEQNERRDIVRRLAGVRF